jgi:hypothetical protein
MLGLGTFLDEAPWAQYYEGSDLKKLLEDQHSHFLVDCESMLLDERRLILRVVHAGQRDQRWTLSDGKWSWCWVPDGGDADDV